MKTLAFTKTLALLTLTIFSVACTVSVGDDPTETDTATATDSSTDSATASTSTDTDTGSDTDTSTTTTATLPARLTLQRNGLWYDSDLETYCHREVLNGTPYCLPDRVSAVVNVAGECNYGGSVHILNKSVGRLPVRVLTLIDGTITRVAEVPMDWAFTERANGNLISVDIPFAPCSPITVPAEDEEDVFELYHSFIPTGFTVELSQLAILPPF